MKLPYLQHFRDSQGKMRFYVRNTLTKRRIAIKIAPGDPQFMALYRGALVELGLIPPERYAERQRIMHRVGDHGWERWRIGHQHKPRGRRLRGTRTKPVATRPKVSRFERP
jgi:hypothetical protein